MSELPKKSLNEFLTSVAPDVGQAFRQLRAGALAAGPLPHDTLELILLACFATNRMESAFKGHARRALNNGLPKEQMQHAVIATLGATLPMAAVAEALMWIDEAG